MSKIGFEISNREKIEAIKKEWKQLWLSRIDDKFLAEGIANNHFSTLAIERGTVIVASRDFKPLDLREILRAHSAQFIDRIISPHPAIGGYTKFARTVLNKQPRNRKLTKNPTEKKSINNNRQRKKSGRGWLHSH